MQRAIVVLPLPDSPTSATQRPCGDAERDVVDGGARRRPRRYSTLEPRDLEQRRRRSAAAAAARGALRPALAQRRARCQRTQRTAWLGATCSSAGHAGRSSGRPACSQRGAKAQPAGHSPTPTDDAGDALQRARVAEVGDRGDQRRACTGAAAARCTSAAGPSSTTRPAYMTAIRSAILRDDREVVRDVDHRHAAPRRAAGRARQDALLGERRRARGRLVEHDDRRLADAGHRDRHALLLAARELVRVARARSARRRPARRARAPRCTDSSERGRRPVRAQHVHDRVADPQRRVERAARILRHVGDDPAAQARSAALASRPIDLLGRRPRSAPRAMRRRGACSRAARAPSSSCRCPTRRPARGSRPAPTREADVLDHRLAGAQRQAQVSTRTTGAVADRAHASARVRVALGTYERPRLRAIASPMRLMPIVSSAIIAAGASTAQTFSEMYCAVLADHQRPVGAGRLQAEAEEVDRGDDQDRVGEAQAGVGQHRRQDVRQHLADDHGDRALAARDGRLDVAAHRDLERRRAHDPADARRLDRARRRSRGRRCPCPRR